MPLGIAVPTTVPLAATPVIVIIVVVTRPRAGEPSLVIPCRHRMATIIVIVPAAAGRTSAIRTFARKGDCDGAADPGISTGDQCNAPSEFAIAAI